MAPTKVLLKDPCCLGLPVMLTLAPMTRITSKPALYQPKGPSRESYKFLERNPRARLREALHNLSTVSSTQEALPYANSASGLHFPRALGGSKNGTFNSTLYYSDGVDYRIFRWICFFGSSQDSGLQPVPFAGDCTVDKSWNMD